MKERPILFSAPMVRAILAGQKTQTRRTVKLPANEPSFRGGWEPCSIGGAGIVTPRGGLTSEEPCIWNQTTGKIIACPYGIPGDRLWVRETWYCDNYTERDFDAARVGHVTPRTDEEIIAEWSESLYYRADTASGHGSCCELIPECMCAEYKTKSGRTRSPWKPGIHMPRWASRLTLEVTSVRVERLHAITEDDARAEGVSPYVPGHGAVTPEELAVEPGLRSPQMYRFGFEQVWHDINGIESWDANPWVWVVSFKRIKAQERAA